MKEKLNLPESSTIRYEQVTCSKDCRHDTHRYYYAYTWDCNSKKLKKKYIGKQLPLPTVILGQCLSQGIKIRVFHRNDSERVIELISDIIVNEFNFKLEFNTLDCDIFDIEENHCY